jgi:hypothetical protein
MGFCHHYNHRFFYDRDWIGISWVSYFIIHSICIFTNHGISLDWKDKTMNDVKKNHW